MSPFEDNLKAFADNLRVAMTDSHNETPPAAASQVGGSYYHGRGIQPWDIIEAWDLDFWEGNAIKYILRRKPGTPRTLDLQKAIHYLEKCLERARAAENPAPLA